MAGFSDVPTFETTTGILDSTRCVLVLTDEHPTPYASGQERYIIEFVVGQNDVFQLVHGNLIKKIFVRQLYEWDSTDGKVAL